MMKKRQSVGVVGPLSLYVEGFRQGLEDRGYAPDSVRWRLRQFTALDQWLREQCLAASDLDAAGVERLVAARRAQGRTTFISVANFAVPIAYLRGIDVVPAISSPIDQAGQMLEWYRRYLVTERGLTESSIPVTLHVAESFCRKLDHRLEELSAAEVSAYIAALSARSSIGWSKKTVSALASFLRFLHVTGVTTEPLAVALPKLAGYRRTVPCELDEGDFTRLRDGCDCSRDVGLRDRAILTVLWRLGLRHGEVAGLKVDDINWRRGEITIRGKSNRQELLPIPVDVGETIVSYLRNGHRRLPPGCRTLFVQMRAPEGPMTPTGVGDVVARACRRVGLPAMGAHRLRHGTATMLVRSGASWTEIAQVLRHRTIAVTASYTTVDSALTRELARTWPGAR